MQPLLSTSRSLFPHLVSFFFFFSPSSIVAAVRLKRIRTLPYPLFRLPRVPESLLKKRKTAEKYAVEKAIQNVEKKKVRLPPYLISYFLACCVANSFDSSPFFFVWQTLKGAGPTLSTDGKACMSSCMGSAERRFVVHCIAWQLQLQMYCVLACLRWGRLWILNLSVPPHPKVLPPLSSAVTRPFFFVCDVANTLAHPGVKGKPKDCL